MNENELAKYLHQMEHAVRQAHEVLGRSVLPDISAISEILQRITKEIGSPALEHDIANIVKKRMDPNYKPNGLERAKDIVSGQKGKESV